MRLRSKQTCVDCHFFVKEVRDTAGAPYTLTVTADERALARKGDYTWHKSHLAICCSFGVWDEGHMFDMAKRHEVIVETERRNFCFFWRYRAGMMLPAAKTLQEREAQQREATIDRRLTVWGLWIAAAALLASVYMQVAEKLSWFPF